MTMPSLFDKLDNVTVQPAARLEPQDQEFCQRVTDALINALSCLDQSQQLAVNAEEGFQALQERDSYPVHFLAEHHFDKARQDARDAFAHRIVHHFHRRHDVDLDLHPFKELSKAEAITADAVADLVLEGLGGLSFQDQAVQQLRDAFRNIAVKSYAPVTLSKRVVKLPRFFYVDDFWLKHSGDIHVNNYEAVYELLRALAHFEDASWLKPSFHFQKLIDANYRHGLDNGGKPFELSTKRLKSVQVYRNGNVKLSFATGEDATAFVRYYDLLETP